VVEPIEEVFLTTKIQCTSIWYVVVIIFNPGPGGIPAITPATSTAAAPTRPTVTNSIPGEAFR
jgi:hypothetical protein